MVMALTPTQDQCSQAVRAFLLAVLPAGVEVINMQVSRVPEPAPVDFVAVNQISRTRLATNIDAFTDITFEGSITDDVLTAASVTGTLVAGLPVLGAGIAVGTTLGGQLSGPAGGAGTYAVAPSQTVTDEPMSAGTRSTLEKAAIVMQVDVHGGDSSSADNAQIIATLFRDTFAVDFFAASGVDIAPLHADEAKQLPFINAEQQWESRWSLDLHLEGNFVVLDIPQQFAASLELDLIDVEAAYPV